jgi:predicted nucleic acid-binding protein
MILADTSAWLDFLRGDNSPQRQTLHRLIEDDRDVAITEIILAEILQGIRDDAEFKATRDYLFGFTILRPQGIETYLQAAQIYRNCRKKGRTVRKTADCIIAAICIENDLTLLHKDSDFKLIAECNGLKVF